MATSSPRSSDTLSDIKDKDTDAFGAVSDRAEKMASRVADQSREAGESFQKVAGNMKGAVDKSLKDQPMATLAFAAAVGFILGAIWKS
jgi:ElaB/YqjD/DUF883 family membrane-anchored ribosome-binding protein